MDKEKAYELFIKLLNDYENAREETFHFAGSTDEEELYLKKEIETYKKEAEKIFKN